MSDTGARTTPTVVVARVPAPGREAEFERWLHRLVDAAAQAPGYVHAAVQPPDTVHPGEWVTVYQFDGVTSLDAWLASPVRTGILAGGDGLTIGTDREQVLALTTETDPVTAVASFRVTPGSEADFVQSYGHLVSRLATFGGFARSELFEPVEGVQDDTVIAFSFDSREHLDTWLDSDDRRRMLEELDQFIDGERTLNVVGGFGGWFGRPGAAEVTRWKQAAVVLLALFPTALVLTRLRMWLLPDVNWVVGVFLGNLLGVVILSWMLMPVLTARLDRWLRR